MASLASPINAWDYPGLATASLGGALPRSERVSAAVLVGALHAVAIALVLSAHSPGPLPATPGMIAFDIRDDGQRAPHRQISPPHRQRVIQPTPAALIQVGRVDVDPILVPAAAITSLDAAAPDLVVVSGGSCDLTPTVQDALRHSDDVRRQLPAIPSDRRSVANAIVVWNAGWSEPAGQPAQASFAAVRQAITQAVAASSPACRNQLQRGPRLLFVPGASGAAVPGTMTILALGSGQWTWQQLVDGGQPLPASVMAAADAPPAPFAIVGPAVAAPGQTAGLEAMLARLIDQRTPAAVPYYP